MNRKEKFVYMFHMENAENLHKSAIPTKKNTFYQQTRGEERHKEEDRKSKTIS